MQLVLLTHIGQITLATPAASPLRTTGTQMTRIGVIAVIDDTAHATIATPSTRTSVVFFFFLLLFSFFFLFSVPLLVHCHYA